MCEKTFVKYGVRGAQTQAWDGAQYNCNMDYTWAFYSALGGRGFHQGLGHHMALMLVVYGILRIIPL